MQKSDIIKKMISIPEWHQMAKNGDAPPVRIQLNGNSMFPLVRMNRDFVTVVQMKKKPDIGDIIIFCELPTGRYVAHRVWETQDEMVRTWGDNCRYPDAWIPISAVLGKIILIERGKRRMIPDPIKGMRHAKAWRHVRRIYWFFKRYKQAIMRRIKRLRKG